jgi:hypothetical protein
VISFGDPIGAIADYQRRRRAYTSCSGRLINGLAVTGSRQSIALN